MAEYVLTDGKNYVIRNQFKIDEYLLSTSYVQAERFDYRKAKALLKNPRGKIRSIKNNGFYMLDVESGEIDKKSFKNSGNGGVFVGKNDVEFDESILDAITEEVNSILSLSGWSLQELQKYKDDLSTGLSKCDSIETDIGHLLEKYRKEHDGKKPACHKITKVGYILMETRELRRKIKQCQGYIQVMIDAITYKYGISKICTEMSKNDNGEYKPRTEYYQIVQDILNS